MTTWIFTQKNPNQPEPKALKRGIEISEYNVQKKDWKERVDGDGKHKGM